MISSLARDAQNQDWDKLWDKVWDKLSRNCLESWNKIFTNHLTILTKSQVRGQPRKVSGKNHPIAPKAEA